MATLSGDKKYVTVTRGDTLSQIAITYKSYTGGASYQQLANWNKIANPNKIYVGQKIYLSKSGASGSSSSSTTTKKTNSNCCTNVGLGLSSGSDSELVSTWDWHKAKDTKEYLVQWKRWDADGKNFVTEESVKNNFNYYDAAKYKTYSIPANTKRVDFRVKPISIKDDIKTKDKNGNEKVTGQKDRFKADWTAWKQYTVSNPLNAPDAPSIKLEGFKLTASLSKFGDHADTGKLYVLFRIYANEASVYKDSEWIKVTPNHVQMQKLSWSCNVKAGIDYTVRARFKYNNLYSDWSSVSGSEKSAPTAPSKITKCEECSIDSTNDYDILLQWGKSNTAEKYIIQYTTDKTLFDISDQVQTVDVTAPDGATDKTPPTTRILSGLSAGEYFFRVCAARGNYNSAWTAITSIVLGKPPGAPTTWSSTNKAARGDVVKLYWVHNSIDGSKQTYCNFNITYSDINDTVYYKVNYDSNTKTYTATDEVINKINGYTVGSATVTVTKNTETKIYSVYRSFDGSTYFYKYNPYQTLNVGTDYKNADSDDTTEPKQLFPGGNSSSGVDFFKVYRLYDKTTEGTQLYAELDTSIFKGDVNIKWQVQTASRTMEYGDFSTEREIEVYEAPHIQLMVTDKFTKGESDSIILPDFEEGIRMDVLESFPFYIKALVTSETQTPLSYHLTVTALSSYEGVDELGNDKIIAAGTEVYSNDFDSENLLVEMSAGNIDLENGVEYEVACIVALDSGLSASATSTFEVAWTDEYYSPSAEYALNTDTYSLSIHPHCEYLETQYRKVKMESKQYIEDTIIEDELTIEDVYTESGERVYVGTDSRDRDIYYCMSFENDLSGSQIISWYKVNRTGDLDGIFTRSSRIDINTIKERYTSNGNVVFIGMVDGVESYYCAVDVPVRVENVTLGVYRREFDGSFTEIGSGLDNADNTVVIDPHPSLDYARYRITARTNTTGAISYYDVPAYPIGGKSVIIQWDEDWSTFEGQVEDALTEKLDPPWTGSLLMLPYNIDVTDTTSPEVTHVNYAGRKHPVSYHGTHLGETASWNVTVPKEDTETLYQLRRLKVWMGNVYVREPSGTGYWATITVSDPRKHNDVLVQVTIDITRVEGGI